MNADIKNQRLTCLAIFQFDLPNKLRQKTNSLFLITKDLKI